MKKMILTLLLGFTTLFSTSSCITETYAQDAIISSSDGDVDVSIIVQYGTPYYFEGSILYYLYNGWYYYPYLRNNYYYYYRYSRPLPPPRHGHRFIPRYNDRPYFKHHRDHRRSSTYSRGHHREHNPNISNRPHNRPPKENVHKPHNRQTPQMRNGNRGVFNRQTPQMRNGNTPRGGSIRHGNGRFGGRR